MHVSWAEYEKDPGKYADLSKTTAVFIDSPNGMVTMITPDIRDKVYAWLRLKNILPKGFDVDTWLKADV